MVFAENVRTIYMEITVGLSENIKYGGKNNKKNEKMNKKRFTNSKYPYFHEKKKVLLENPGIDPATSRMLSGRSTI